MSKWAVHKRRYFWTSTKKIQQYIEFMVKEGWTLMFVDNYVYYWSKK